MSEKIKVLKKNFAARCIYTLIMVLASALLQTYVIQVFINASNLLSSGFTGLAILINRISGLFGMQFDVSLMIILLNVPVALLCLKSISTKFTIFSSIQFFCVSIFLKLFHFTPLIDDVMLNCMLGGVLYGFAILLSLKGNASTGGTDFIALYVSNKIGKSIWTQVFIFNCIMLCIFGALLVGRMLVILFYFNMFRHRRSMPSIIVMSGLRCRLRHQMRKRWLMCMSIITGMVSRLRQATAVSQRSATTCCIRLYQLMRLRILFI